MGCDRNKVTVDGANPYASRAVVRSQLELKGYVVYDESSKLTEKQMWWIMNHIKKERRFHGLIPLTKAEDEAMRKETADDVRPSKPQ